MKTTIKRNLFLGLSLSLVLLFISSLASFISIKNLIQSSEMVRYREDVIDKLNSVLSVMKDAETGQRGYLITGDPVYLEPYNNAHGQASELLDYISSKTSDDAFQQKNMKLLTADITNRMRLLNLNLDQKRHHAAVDFDSLLRGKVYMDDIRVIIATMQKEEQRLLGIRSASLNQLAGITPSIIILTALLAIAITLFFYRRVVADFEEKSRLQEDLQRKNEETDRNIHAMENVAAQISKGDYQIRIDKISQDTLGNLSLSLNTMAQSLQQAFTLLEEKEWLQTGIALLNDKMVGEKPVDLLAQDIIENITEYTGSQVAAIYMFDEDKVLHLAGSYAMNTEEGRDKLRPGEGIVGQCLQSGKAILLRDIPANELTISYAFGKTKPRNVAAVPVFKDKVITGVVECGSLENYTPAKLEFLKSISENIGSALYAAQNRRRLQELLTKTQAQSEELQTQHAEMESLNAEREAQTQKLQASEEELRVQQEELLQSNRELEERTSLLEEKNQVVLERNLEIQQKSELIEQSSKYKSEFLANMSHELRTPLNSILLLSKLMSDSKELDKEYIEYADVIQSSGQGLLSLIDEILDLSKIEAGKMTLEPGEVTLQEISNEANALFMPLAKDKCLELKINIAENTSPVLITDKMRLQQILKNLLSNALKFTAHGEVALNISNDHAGKKIILTVTDTGIGIAKDKQHLIFEAFQQADGSTRRKFGGTGLGLSISRELAKLLGGDISLQSTEGKGSEFTLTLPVDIKDKTLEVNGQEELIARMHNAEVDVDPGSEVSGHFIVDHIPNRIKDDRDTISKDDKVILIVEDDTVFAGILIDYTRQKKYKGIVAVRGDEAVNMAKHFKPEAILLDIQLPVMDGWQVMEELKSNPQTRSIPVHIMSSLQVKKESLLKGAVDFIYKPFAIEQMQQIFQKLEDVLSKHPRKVLIVEENKQHANALSYYLSASNINTQIVNNVKDSIDALQKNEIDCVILDMGLTDINAYKTLEVIKQGPGLENLPIIVFTGKSLSISEETRIKKYADSIVVKTAHSYQRILDEAGLFLHLVEEKKEKKSASQNRLTKDSASCGTF